LVLNIILKFFSRSSQESTKVTKLTFNKETKTESSESTIPETLERGRSRSRRIPVELKNSDSTSAASVQSERPIFRTVNVNIKNPVFSSQSVRAESTVLASESFKTKIPVLTNVSTETTVLPDSQRNPVLRETQNPVSSSCYKVKIVRPEESSPVKAVVKVGRIEPVLSDNPKTTFKNDEKYITGQSEKATIGQGATYRDYLVNKKQAKRPLSCDGSSAYSR
jgi:hypothetical protein